MNHGTIASEPNPLVDAQSVNARAAMYFEETKKNEKKIRPIQQGLQQGPSVFHPWSWWFSNIYDPKLNEHTHDGSMVLGEKCQHKGGMLMGSMLPYIAYMDPMG